MTLWPNETRFSEVNISLKVPTFPCVKRGECILRKFYSNISLHVLHTIFHTFGIILTGRIRHKIKSFLSSWSFLLFTDDLNQGRNKVFFFITDPVFLPQILIPDHKNVENFNPWSQKHWEFWSLIPKTFTILIPDSTKTLLIPIPSVVIPGLWSLIPSLSRWSLISYTLLRPCLMFDVILNSGWHC